MQINLWLKDFEQRRTNQKVEFYFKQSQKQIELNKYFKSNFNIANG